jgi:hypothetical protein
VRARLAAALLFVALAAFGSGCTGADARRAETLLQQAQAAQAGVRSESFVLKFAADGGGMSYALDLEGGGYVHGPRAGDFYATMSGSGFPQADSLRFAVVRHGGVVTFRSGGRTASMSLPAAQSQLGSNFTDMSRLLDLERYVTSVSVDEASYKGRPADRIVGKIDTERLLESFGGAGPAALGSAGVHVGDARVVLFVPRDTHLVEGMFADVSVDAHGQKANLRVSVALTSVDKPVRIPIL